MRQRAGVPARVERPAERILLAAIAALLVSALAAALLISGDRDPLAIAREAGSLLAPPSETPFTDAFGRPLTPTSAIPGSDELNDPSGGSPPPETPGNTPPAPAPEKPPDGGGLLDFLRDLPILPPPPLLGSAKAHRGAGIGQGLL